MATFVKRNTGARVEAVQFLPEHVAELGEVFGAAVVGGRLRVPTSSEPLWADEGDWVVQLPDDDPYLVSRDLHPATYTPA